MYKSVDFNVHLEFHDLNDHEAELSIEGFYLGSIDLSEVEYTAKGFIQKYIIVKEKEEDKEEK